MTVYSDRQFQTWSFGSVNIRSGKQKDEGAKIYSIVKAISKAKSVFCCLQEVKYRNWGKKLIQLDNGERYEFHWCGNKKRRSAGVAFIIKVDDYVTIKEPDVLDSIIMAINMIIHVFNLRVLNVYNPTESDDSENKKDVFYRLMNKAAIKQEKHKNFLL